MASILISGEESIKLVCEYLPICGIAIIVVDVLFVVRCGVQGMGHPVPPMWSGVLEMVLRITVIYALMSRLGFMSVAYAEISAWVGALIVNAVAFCKVLLPKLGAVKKPAKLSQGLCSPLNRSA